jgi:hypothetical protein
MIGLSFTPFPMSLFTLLLSHQKKLLPTPTSFQQQRILMLLLQMAIQFIPIGCFGTGMPGLAPCAKVLFLILTC